MNFTFGKKKNEPSINPWEEKKGSEFDRLEDELTVLHKDEMARVEGGKSSNKSLSDLSDLRNTLGGPIPL
jgi:hypothetical protein